jgi:hypothetical protein
MDFWNREQLYAEVWETPLTKLAAKYNVSAVALGKTCRKLQVPLPGRGHWAKKEFGKAPDPTPLPEAKNLPVVHKMERTQYSTSSFNETDDPNDPEIARINAIEQKGFRSFLDSKPHNLISSAAKSLKRCRTDERGILLPLNGETILDVRLSKGPLDRGLRFMNAVILALESEGFPVVVKPDGVITTAVTILGLSIPFALVEKLNASNRREVVANSWNTKRADYSPSGELEFRFGYTPSGWTKRSSDGKKQRLEEIIGECIGRMLRLVRQLRIEAEQREVVRIERQREQKKRDDLAQQIAEEEQKIKDLEAWVELWDKAERIRRFVVALEKVWREQGHDLSVDSTKGQRIQWMKQQADRVDPMLENPPSILDRKKELRYSWQM